jgi:hypothetical protein
LHEFIHLVDKMDGTLDGVPELLLERKYIAQWKQLIEQTMLDVRNGVSDIDAYAATSPVECFAVISEYFFEQPESFQANHPELNTFLQKIFRRVWIDFRYVPALIEEGLTELTGLMAAQAFTTDPSFLRMIPPFVGTGRLVGERLQSVLFRQLDLHNTR